VRVSVGMFRVWVVFSILWIGLGYFVADFPYWQKRVAKLSNHKEFVDKQYAEIITEMNGQPKVNFHEWSKQFSEQYLPKFRAHYALDNAKNNYQLLKFLVFAPPLIALVFGLTFGWIMAGFRGNSNKLKGENT